MQGRFFGEMLTVSIDSMLPPLVGYACAINHSAAEGCSRWEVHCPTHMSMAPHPAVAEGSLGDDFNEDVGGDPEEPGNEEFDDRRAGS